MAPTPPSPFKPDVLAGKVALVTGGGSGIGLEITRQLGERATLVAGLQCAAVSCV